MERALYSELISVLTLAFTESERPARRGKPFYLLLGAGTLNGLSRKYLGERNFQFLLEQTIIDCKNPTICSNQYMLRNLFDFE